MVRKSALPAGWGQYWGHSCGEFTRFEARRAWVGQGPCRSARRRQRPARCTVGEPKRLFYQGDDSLDRCEARGGTRLFSKMRPASKKPECLERTDTCLLRTRKFVVCPVADEPGFRDVDPQAADGLHVDVRIGLRQADFEREHRAVEARDEGAVRPRRNVFRETVADDAEAQIPTPKARRSS